MILLTFVEVPVQMQIHKKILCFRHQIIVSNFHFQHTNQYTVKIPRVLYRIKNTGTNCPDFIYKKIQSLVEDRPFPHPKPFPQQPGQPKRKTK